jgi:hypothetical protein
MKIIMKITILIFSSILILLSCSPDRFYLNQNLPYEEEIAAIKIGYIDSVEKIAKNAFALYSGGFVDLYCQEIPVTQLQADFTVDIKDGEGIDFFFRTIADHFDKHSNINFQYSTNGCKVTEAGRLIVMVDSIKAQLNKPARIKIENYGSLYNITVDCDTVYFGKSNLHATQHILIKPVNITNAVFTGVRFSNMNSDLQKTEGWQIQGFNKNE